MVTSAMDHTPHPAPSVGGECLGALAKAGLMQCWHWDVCSSEKPDTQQRLVQLEPPAQASPWATPAVKTGQKPQLKPLQPKEKWRNQQQSAWCTNGRKTDSLPPFTEARFRLAQGEQMVRRGTAPARGWGWMSRARETRTSAAPCGAGSPRTQPAATPSIIHDQVICGAKGPSATLIKNPMSNEYAKASDCLEEQICQIVHTSSR